LRMRWEDCVKTFVKGGRRMENNSKRQEMVTLDRERSERKVRLGGKRR